MSDEAHSTNYTLIFGVLIGALVLSLVLGAVSSSPAVIGLIFAIAGVKAYLVLTEFMHVKAEPRWVKGIIITAVLVLFILYVGLAPDIIDGFGRAGGGG